MGDSRCKSNLKTIHRFLTATNANWRNSIYIECSGCKFDSKAEHCGDFLFVPDEDGTPLLLPVSDAEILSARLIDKSECLGIISNLRFEALFQKWFCTLQVPADTCRCLDAIKHLHPPEQW